jgi:ribosomal protein S4E
MKKTQPKQVKVEEKADTPEWPKVARVKMGKQPRNTNLLQVELEDGTGLLVRVRDNRFYRVNEKLKVNREADGVYVDIKPKTSPLLRGGQE